jgi:hypothetical protein
VKAKPPAKPRAKAPAAKTTPPEQDPPPRTLDDIDVNRATARLKALREKFGKAIDDPDVRAQMVRYLQGLLRENDKG